MKNAQSTVFHITHWKTGSQWVAEILKHSAPERFIPWSIVNPHAMQGYGLPDFYVHPLIPGKVYGTVYTTQYEFQKIVSGVSWRTRKGGIFYPRRIINNFWNYRILHHPFRAFVIIRDLRDTLTSLYFSTKKSHELVVDRLPEIRNLLTGSSEELGLLYLMNDVLPDSAEIQASWIGARDVLLLHYENILDNEYSFFEELTDYCQISVSRDRLQDIVRYNVFEAATGRKRGQEDISSHLRKGIAGDWRNHFSERVKVEFKKRYGKLLIDTGYEKDLNW